MIRFLASKHSLCNVNTLISVIRSIILAKIDYGLTIYSKCSKSTLKLITPAYHSAVRTVQRSFRTTPIKNILTDAGLTSIPDRIEFQSASILLKISFGAKSPIQPLISKILRRTRHHNYPSSLSKAIQLSSKWNIQVPTTPEKPPALPPWKLSIDSINTDLHKLKKTSSNTEMYRQMFMEMVSEFIGTKWNFLYTDGSKNEHGTSFAVVDDLGNTRIKGLLPSSASIFTAEAFAILKATNFTDHNRTVIFSDSLATITAIKNINNQTEIINRIRDKIISNKNLKIIWVPGHAGIPGNEMADKIAKTALGEPLLHFNTLNKKDSRKHILQTAHTLNITSWKDYSHYYSQINPQAQKTIYPTNIPQNVLRCYIRLRLGHCNITHKHYITREQQPLCHLCNQNIPFTMNHFTIDCQFIQLAAKKICPTNSRFHLLTLPSEQNMKDIFKILTSIKIENQI